MLDAIDEDEGDSHFLACCFTFFITDRGFYPGSKGKIVRQAIVFSFWNKDPNYGEIIRYFAISGRRICSFKMHDRVWKINRCQYFHCGYTFENELRVMYTEGKRAEGKFVCKNLKSGCVYANLFRK
jgi:hypothetical protein